MLRSTCSTDFQVERYSPQNKEKKILHEDEDRYKKEIHTINFDENKENLDPENLKLSKQRRYEKKELTLSDDVFIFNVLDLLLSRR